MLFIYLVGKIISRESCKKFENFSVVYFCVNFVANLCHCKWSLMTSILWHFITHFCKLRNFREHILRCILRYVDYIYCSSNCATNWVYLYEIFIALSYSTIQHRPNSKNKALVKLSLQCSTNMSKLGFRRVLTQTKCLENFYWTFILHYVLYFWDFLCFT